MLRRSRSAEEASRKGLGSVLDVGSSRMAVVHLTARSIARAPCLSRPPGGPGVDHESRRLWGILAGIDVPQELNLGAKRCGNGIRMP